MNIQAWWIYALPQITVDPPTSPDDWPVLQHVNTSLRSFVDEMGRAIGVSTWARFANDAPPLMVAWDWIEVAPGCVALADPNGIVSNVRLCCDDDDELEHEGQRRLFLNSIIWRLRWQEHALAATRANAAPAPRIVDRPVRTWTRWPAALKSAA